MKILLALTILVSFTAHAQERTKKVAITSSLAGTAVASKLSEVFYKNKAKSLELPIHPIWKNHNILLNPQRVDLYHVLAVAKKGDENILTIWSRRDALKLTKVDMSKLSTKDLNKLIDKAELDELRFVNVTRNPSPSLMKSVKSMKNGFKVLGVVAASASAASAFYTMISWDIDGTDKSVARMDQSSRANWKKEKHYPRTWFGNSRNKVRHN